MPVTKVKSGWPAGRLEFAATATDGAVLFGDATSDLHVRVRGVLTDKRTVTNLTATTNVTAAQLLTRVIVGTPTAAATYTLPTASALVAALPGAAVGDAFTFVVRNASAGANTITVAAGTGGTASGTLTVAQGVVRAFLVFLTAVPPASPTYAVYGIG